MTLPNKRSNTNLPASGIAMLQKQNPNNGKNPWKHSKTPLLINDMPQRNRTYTKVRETIIANTESVDASLQARMNNNWNLLVIPFNQEQSQQKTIDHWNISTRKIVHHTKVDLPDALLAHHRWHCNIARKSNVPSTHPLKIHEPRKRKIESSQDDVMSSCFWHSDKPETNFQWA